MRCQHIGEDGQCLQEAARDIRVVTAREGWRIFLCAEHVEIEMEKLRKIVDRMAVEQEGKHVETQTQDRW